MGRDNTSNTILTLLIIEGYKGEMECLCVCVCVCAVWAGSMMAA